MTFKIPDAWIKMADELAASMAVPGVTITRTDALRAALAEGLERMHAEKVKGAKPRGKR